MDKTIKLLLIVAIVVVAMLILVTPIILGALFAFGIFAPTAIAPCTGFSKLLYRDHVLGAGSLMLVVANGTGSALDDAATAGIVSGSGVTGVQTMGCTSGDIASGANFTCATPANTVTSPYTAHIQLTYKSKTSGLTYDENVTCKG